MQRLLLDEHRTDRKTDRIRVLIYRLAVYPAVLAGRERFIIIIYNITHSTKHHPSPTLSFLRHHIN